MGSHQDLKKHRFCVVKKEDDKSKRCFVIDVTLFGKAGILWPMLMHSFGISFRHKKLQSKECNAMLRFFRHWSRNYGWNDELNCADEELYLFKSDNKRGH